MEEHWAALLLCSATFDTTANEICCNSFMGSGFHRKKYDARKTFEGFAVKLHDETDFDALNNELAGRRGDNAAGARPVVAAARPATEEK
jgi:hypothetical protein